MTTQDQTIIGNEVPTNNNEVPAITQGEAPNITNHEEPAKSAEEVAQSSDSLEPSKEQDKPQGNVAHEANPKHDPDDDYPEPYPMGEELKSQFSVINACIGEINNIVWLAGVEGSLVGREVQLQDLLGEFERACVQVELAIELNARQKQTEDLVALDAFAKTRGYPDWAAMQETLDHKGADHSQAPAQTDVKTGRNEVPKAPYDRYLKDQFTKTGQTDPEAGYYSKHGIRPQAKWCQDFKDKYGDFPTADHCRDATPDEMKKQAADNLAKFNRINRRPGGKKA